MIACTKCKNPHDLRSLREEDKIFEDPVRDIGPISILSDVVYKAAGFSYIAPQGPEAASVEGGSLIIIRCPACIQPDPEERENNDLTTT